jgi:hypothetical protein
MRSAASVLAALVLGGCAATPAPRSDVSEACERKVPPGRVEVITVPVKPTIDTTLSYRQLTSLARREDGAWVLGLTRPALRVEARWSYAGLSDAGGQRACIRPSVSMRLRYEPVNVFIGREFLDDECAYRFILDHEQRHVGVHVRRLGEVAAELQRELEKHLAGIVHVGPRDELDRRLKAEVAERWMPLAERELKDVAREHAAIDSPQEYARAASACQGRIASVIAAHRDAAGR